MLQEGTKEWFMHKWGNKEMGITKERSKFLQAALSGKPDQETNTTKKLLLI